MDVLQAHCLVETTLESLKQFSRCSLIFYEAAKKFSNWANYYFDHENIEIAVQYNFPEIKIRKSNRRGSRSIIRGGPFFIWTLYNTYNLIILLYYNY